MRISFLFFLISFLMSCNVLDKQRNPSSTVIDNKGRYSETKEPHSIGGYNSTSDPNIKKIIPNDNIIFIGPDTSQSSKNAEAIASYIQNSLKNLKKQCQKKDLNSAKQLATQLENLQAYASKTYAKNKYLISQINVKDGNQSINLGLFLQDIEEILKGDAYHMDYKTIQGSKNLKSACDSLHYKYTLSYSFYYKIPENKNIYDEMNPWAQKVYQAIECLCSEVLKS